MKKAERIRNTLQETKERRKIQRPIVFQQKFVNSIALKQYGVSYKLDFARNRVRIQKLGSFRVLGLHQIPDNAEIANAVLV
ncbi:MAG: putative transposase, partial [Pseudothermotoga sp.]|nr:putative transposase [Pseudothermotoga sp.]